MSRIILPTKGLFYTDFTIPNGEVTIKDLGTRGEKLLGNISNVVTFTSKVISMCMVEPKIAPDATLNLTIGDRAFLFYCIRSESYGHGYAFMVKCPSCRLKFEHSTNIPDDLSVKVAEDDAVEPFYVALPNLKKKIGLRLLRGRDEVEIMRYEDSHYSKRQVSDEDPAYEYRLARHIVSVDGEDISLLKATDLVLQMSSMDSLHLRQAIDDNDCGLDLNISMDCPKCSEMIEMVLPVTKEFFRPKVKVGDTR